MNDESLGAVASPEATGGAGMAAELRLGAVALAALLAGNSLPGMPVALTRVGFQQRLAGRHLDDLILYGESGSGMELTVDYQSKRTLAPVPSNPDFIEVVTACIKTIQSDPEGTRPRRRRLGLAAANPVAQLRELRRVAELAASHADLESFQATLTPHTTDAKVRQRYQHLRTTVANALTGINGQTSDDAETDRLTWKLASSLEVWIAEVEGEGRDAQMAVDRLTGVAHDRTAAASTFHALVTLAIEWAPKAAIVDVQMLRAELDRRGIALDIDRRGRAAFVAVEAYTKRTLGRTREKMAQRLHLPRQVLRDTISSAALSTRVTLVTGKAGAGKSVLTRLAARDLRESRATVFLLELASGMSPTELDLKLEGNLRVALEAAPTGTARLLVLDGAEQALSDNGRLLRYVLQALPSQAPGWHLVLTVRDEAALPVQQIAVIELNQAPTILRVGDLSDTDVSAVLAAFPQLRSIARHPRPRRLLLRRPYLVDLLAVATRAGGVGAPQLLGEEDVIDLVEDRLIRLAHGSLPGRGNSTSRADVFLRLADAVIEGRLPARLDGMDGEAREGLCLDNIIERDNHSYRFAHDVLADYAVTARLLEPDGEGVLQAAPEPRRLLRAARLWMQHRMAAAIGNQHVLGTRFDECVGTARRLAAADGERWESLPFEALLQVGPSTQLLAGLESRLLEKDGKYLELLLDVTRRMAPPYPGSVENADTVIDVTLSAPVVDLLTRLGPRVPEHLRPTAAALIRSHLAQLPLESISDWDLLPHAADLPSSLANWAEGVTDHGSENQNLLASLLLAAPYLSPAEDGVILESTRRRPHDIGVLVEDAAVAAVLATHRPDLLLRLSGQYYVNRELLDDPKDDVAAAEPTQNGRFTVAPDDRFEVRRHLYRKPPGPLAGPERGPFRTLLRADATRGLRLIGAIVDVATDHRIRLQGGYGTPETQLQLELRGGTRKMYHGTADVWVWYRMLSVGPYPAMSALMALQEWALRSIRDGRALLSVTEDVLCCGESIAFVAVALSVVIDSGSRSDEIDRFLAHPLVWALETARIAGEGSLLAPPLPENSRLLWLPSQIAVDLVLSATAERCEQLKQVGDQLLTRAYELVPGAAAANPCSPELETAQLQVRRWATELDASALRVEQVNERQFQVSIGLSEDVQKGLEERGGRKSELWLRLQSLAFQAMKLRDASSEEELADTAILTSWGQTSQIAEELGQSESAGVSFQDAFAAIGAALIRRAAVGHEVEPGLLNAAASVLLYIAEQKVPDLAIREAAWDLGADRSAAVALPLLLDERLRAAAGVGAGQVRDALLQLAAPPITEVRSRLVAGLQPEWQGAPHGEEGHSIALDVTEELVASCGYGPRRATGNRSPIRLAKPFEESLDTDKLVLDLAGAADAIPGLVAASHGDCPHAERAANLLRVLVEYDRRVWPTHAARRHDYSLSLWRQEIDTVLADRALCGHPADLLRHVEAFARVAEDLRGVLTQLTSRATTPEQGAALCDLWPQLLDQLLPANRQLSFPESRSQGFCDDQSGHPDQRDVIELDRALLLLPPRGGSWPPQQTGALLRRWTDSFKATPHVADRLITVLAQLEALASPVATKLVLGVLGDNPKSIMRDARSVVAWLRLVLAAQPGAVDAKDRRAVRGLLDRLVASGDRAALALQQQLEA